MNLLVANSPQVLSGDEWLPRLGATVADTANALDEEGVATLSTAIDVAALRAYRTAVGRRTRVIVQQLKPAQLSQKVAAERIQQLLAERAVDEAALSIVDYWSKRTIAGLLLMPASRHNLIHLNEIARLKGRKE